MSIIGDLIRDQRLALGLTQQSLSDRLGQEDGNGNGDGQPGRDQVKRWESGRVTPGKRWLACLSTVLSVPLAELSAAATAARMERRAFLSAVGAAIPRARKVELREMLASIAGGDESWLSRHIVPYDFTEQWANLANRDQGTRWRLVRWLDDGSTSMLRGNAQSALFKTQKPELIERAEQSMRYDAETRARCLRCFTRRAFSLSWPDARTYTAIAASTAQIRTLGALLHDQHDASNRWCAAVFLGEAVSGGSADARDLLVGALRSESSRENLRAIGLAAIGEHPWS
ncbi:helix-turn-helix transcriptional regulator [Kitasatospora sp. NPDC093558]|uniref:helix-turn-helix domain-containing protein n=1 Tax=Kitasatospora sp. NPDC093558 TaxID=3155201 RepID=UPI00343E4166